MVQPPADTFTFSTTPDTTTSSESSARVTATKEQVPGKVTTSTTSAPPKLASLRPLTALATTSLSPSLTPQPKYSSGLKTNMSTIPGLQGLLLLTVLSIATLVPQVQEKMPTLASPAHVNILPGAPAQPNAPRLAEALKKPLPHRQIQ